MKKMKNKGYTVAELLIVIAVFSVLYFGATFIVSKSIGINYEEELYQEKITAIETQAAIYARQNKDIFKDSPSVYMTINELAVANAVISNSEGKVTDPRSKDEDLNELKVKITSDSDKVTAKVLV